MYKIFQSRKVIWSWESCHFRPLLVHECVSFLFVQIALEGDDVGSVTEISEQDQYDYWEIDPLEKEWMLAAAEASLDNIHRLIMTDNYLVNRKDFIHGYTALHWAAKHGRCDIITVLIMSGGMVDIRSVRVQLRFLCSRLTVFSSLSHAHTCIHSSVCFHNGLCSQNVSGCICMNTSMFLAM